MESVLITEEIEKPRNSLQAQVWSKLYRDASMEDQIKIMKDIMANLNISFIKAGDTASTGKFVWMVNDRQGLGSMSSSIISSLGYMHAHKDLNEKCSLIVKTLLNKSKHAFVVNSNYISLTHGEFKNERDSQNNMKVYLCGCPFMIKINLIKTPLEVVRGMPRLSPETKLFFLKEILESDELYQKFIEVWKPDEELVEAENIV